MESSLLFPPVKRPIYTTSTTMHEPNTNNTTHLPTSAASRRSKPPQPPLSVPSGHIAFRLLCHASRIGGLIGRSGSIIKQLQQLTNCKIRVEDPTDSSDHRVISVVASPAIIHKIKISAAAAKEEEEEASEGIGDYGNEEWFDVSAAQAGIVRVFERVVEVTAEGDDVAAIDGVVSCRLLVWKNQGGAVIGKGGKVVEKIRKDTGCRIKVLTVEGSLPTDEIVEIEGNVLAVKKALVAVTGRLQEFPPLDRTRTFGTRPLETESVPIPSVDLPLQRAPILPQMPSNSANHASGVGPSSLESEKASNMDYRTPQQEIVFKILCLNERVGGIIGKGGSIVKALQTETGASISIGPTVAECDERLITITAMEGVDSQYSPAQNAAVLVFNRSMEAGLVNGMDSDAKGSLVSARVVVPSNQVGCLLGKGGAIISEMRKVTGAALRIFGGNQVPKCASENDEILQITGEFLNVQDALYKVTDRLRSNMFSIRMSTGSGNRNFSRTENSAFGRVRDPPPFGSQFSVGGSDNLNDLKSLSESMDHLGISNNIDQPSSPSSLTPTTVYGVNQRNVTDIGERSPSVINGVELGSSGSRSAVVTNTTVEIVVPDNVIGSIYGENGSNLSRLRQISGAKVIVQEPRPGTTQITVVISGTPDETQAAQSLLQAFMLS
ncbi:KH domain-containing protein HEN4 isoform X1 [Sesamum indicum]|uniref:KH domain-containing protein HEN4 isoform X1 n=1 Tax=Sesamum indicum TaxID=4182 RepID=A0A6I9TSV1_SESIN|nr:KH domain-containing protein HEN4 isoform X1 [Sesamum indicum]